MQIVSQGYVKASFQHRLIRVFAVRFSDAMDPWLPKSALRTFIRLRGHAV